MGPDIHIPGAPGSLWVVPSLSKERRKIQFRLRHGLLQNAMIPVRLKSFGSPTPQ